MTTRAPRLRITNIADLIAVIPRLLRFHPRESLVVLAILDGELQVTARVDLAACSDAASARAHLGAVLRRFPGALFLTVAFAADADAAWHALGAWREAASDAGDVHCFHADGTRWFDAPDAPGEPYDVTVSAVAAEAAFLGLPARASRAELEASVDPTVTPHQVSRALRAYRRRGWDHEALIAGALAIVEASDREDARPLSLPDALALALASHDLAFREAAIWSTSRANAWRRIDVWTQVVRGTPPGCAGFALAILGVAAWIAGEGALQVVCLERARAVGTDEVWADFLEHVNRDVVPPTDWDRLREQWSDGACDACGLRAEAG